MIPESIQIGPHRFALAVDTAAVNAECVRSGRHIFGFTEIGAQRIVVSAEPELTGTMLREVVVHECLHAICDTQGVAYGMGNGKIEYSEEALLQALDTPLLALLRANPELVAWLTEVPA